MAVCPSKGNMTTSLPPRALTNRARDKASRELPSWTWNVNRPPRPTAAVTGVTVVVGAADADDNCCCSCLVVNAS